MALDPRQVELAVLNQVIDLHPRHLESAELVRLMSGERGEEREIERAIRGLVGAGLLREDDGRVLPTWSALHAQALFTL
jgi:hypothetical protein